MTACSIDWGLLGTWAQVGAILLTGGAAVFVANRQLDAFNKQLRASNNNERIRNTLKLLDDFNTMQPLVGSKAATVQEAIVFLQVTANTVHDVQRYKRVTIERQTKKPTDLSQDDLDFYTLVQNRCVLACNYFATVASLIDRELADEAMILSLLGRMVMNTYDAVVKLGNVTWNLRPFRLLSEKAEVYERNIETD